MPDLALLESRLSALRRGVRARFLLGGLARVAVAACVAIALVVLIDWLIRADAWSVRGVFLGLALAIVVAVALKALWGPLSLPMPDEDLALAVERRFPQLQDRLISALQLGRAAGRSPAFNSPALAARAMDEAVEACGPLAFAEAVPIPAQRRWTGLAAVALAGFAFLAWGSPEFRIGLLRLVSDVPWPSAYDLEVELAADRVAQGDSLPVVARLKEGSRFPLRVVLHARGTGDALELTMPLQEGAFRAHLEHLQEDVQVWVTAGDFRSRTFAVRVLEKPVLKVFQVRVTPPEYAGLPAQVLSPNSGHLRALRGSRVSVEGTCSKPLAAAAVALTKRTVPLTLTEPTRFSGEFVVEEGGSYVFTMEDQEGLKASHPVSYQLTIIQDQAPFVRIIKPGKDLSVVATARIPVEAEIQDDYGLGAGTLQSVHNRGTADEQKASQPLFEASAAKDVRQLKPSLVWDLAPLKLEPGRQIRYHAEAADLDTVSGPNVGRSQEFGITIVSREDWEADTQRRIEEMVSDLTRSKDRARDIRNAMEALAVSKDPAAASQAAGMALEEGRLAESVQQVRDALRALQENVAMSGLEDARRDQMLQGAADSLKSLVEERLPAVGEQIRAGGRGEEGAWPKAKQGQEGVVQELDKAAKGLSGAASFGELLKRLERLIERSDGISSKSGRR